MRFGEKICVLRFSRENAFWRENTFLLFSRENAFWQENMFCGFHEKARFAVLAENVFWWENTFFGFGGKIRYGGKTRFVVLARKHVFMFWRKKRVLGFLVWKHVFVILAWKHVLRFFAGKHIFAILAGKHVFAILSGNAFLVFWREKKSYLGFRGKIYFCGFVSFHVWQNDIMFRFVICELHLGHNKYYTILNEPSPSKWSKLLQLNGL